MQITEQHFRAYKRQIRGGDDIGIREALIDAEDALDGGEITVNQYSKLQKYAEDIVTVRSSNVCACLQELLAHHCRVAHDIAQERCHPTVRHSEDDESIDSPTVIIEGHECGECIRRIREEIAHDGLSLPVEILVAEETEPAMAQ